MNAFKKICLTILCFALFVSCEKYEDYIFDHIPTVYFGAQKPLRTLVARDADMEFKLGVVLAGVRENKNEEWVRYRFEPELLEDTTIVGDNQFVQMPGNYYSLSNDDTFVVYPGDVIGEVVVSINHSLFTSDPDALNNTYAFPLRIVETSADRILDGEDDTQVKDYTIVVVKYISQYSGFYYRRGVQYELDSQDNHIDTISFTNMSLNKSDVWYLETQAANIVKTTTTADIAATSPRNLLEITVDENQEVSVVSFDDDVELLESTASYSYENNTFTLDYSFMKGDARFHVLDTLIQRQDPELDLRFEQW